MKKTQADSTLRLTGLERDNGANIEQKEEPDSKNSAAIWISIDQLEPGKLQARKYFSEEGINNLARTFENDGFHGAINVRPLKSGKYEIVAGERRWLAAKRAGLDKISVISENFSDIEALRFGLAENLLREDLSQLEETEAILQLIEIEHQLSREKIIHTINTEGHIRKRTGRNVSTSDTLQKIIDVLDVYSINLQTFRTKHLKVLKWPEELKEAHLKQNLAYTAAIELHKIQDLDQRKELLQQVLNQELSVRDVKKLVKRCLKNVVPTASNTLNSVLHRLRVVSNKVKESKVLSDEIKLSQVETLLEKIESIIEMK